MTGRQPSATAQAALDRLRGRALPKNHDARTISALAANPGTLTATPNPTLPSDGTSLQVVFGSAAAGAGIPSGLVTFKDGTTSLGTAPLTFATGSFAATAGTANLGSDFFLSDPAVFADLNRDGKDDIVVSNNASGTVTILFGK